MLRDVSSRGARSAISLLHDRSNARKQKNMTEPVELKDIPVSHLAVVREDMQTQKSVAEGTLEQIQTLPVENQEDYDFAAELLVDVRKNRTLLENERGKATRGLLDTLNVIRGWFKPAVDYWDACEVALKAKMSTYVQSRRQQQQAALQAAGEASMRGEAEAAHRGLQAAREAAVHKAPGARIQTVLMFEVEDFTLVPREFLCVNNAAIEAYVREHGKASKIPGVKIWEDTKIVAQAVRGK